MKILKMCLAAVTLVSFFAQQVEAMDSASSQKLIDGKSLRKSIRRDELPEIQDKSPKIERGLCDIVFRYHDNNFVQKLSELTGQSATQLHDDRHDRFHDIDKSFKVRTGHWHVSDDQVAFVSTGNVFECVTIVVQCENPSLIGMYHYFQRDDEDFEKLHEFLEAVKIRAAQLSIDVSDLKVSLISSYLSLNFLLCKRICERNGFAINLCSAPFSVSLNAHHYVESDCHDAPGRLILANHSELKIYYKGGVKADYAQDPHPDDAADCSVM